MEQTHRTSSQGGKPHPAPSNAQNHAPLSEKSHVESLNEHNEFWHEWAENRRADEPRERRKANRLKFSQIGGRLLGLGLLAIILLYIFSSLAATAH